MLNEPTPVGLTDILALQGVTADLQLALTCLDDILGDHPEPCEPFSDADHRCTESWMDIDDTGRCTHRIAHELLTRHGIRNPTKG